MDKSDLCFISRLYHTSPKMYPGTLSVQNVSPASFMPNVCSGQKKTKNLRYYANK